MATTKVIKDLTELNPGNPDYVLNATNAVTVINAGGNQYNFNGVYGKFGLRIGTTVLTGVPVAHPIAVLNNGLTGITYTGTFFNTLDVGGVTYNFYTGDVTITVTADFGVASYYCYYHGYMGGENNFVSVYSEAGLRMPSSNAAYSGPTAEEGMMRNEVGQVSVSSASTMQHYNGTDWKNFVNKALPNFNVDYLVVAGGGAGIFGGGGGGGLRATSSYGGAESALTVSPGSILPIVVGDGGTAHASASSATSAQQGGISTFSTITSVGGGAGGYNNILETAMKGGSGGGGGAAAGGSDFVGGDGFNTGNGDANNQGFDGGIGRDVEGGGAGGSDGPGGGGGAGALGANGLRNGGVNEVGGDGGAGKNINITGPSLGYAGGGGGGTFVSTNNVAGGTASDGGGAGGNSSSGNPTGDEGSPNTGGGGGGAVSGKNGGTGIVILRCTKAAATFTVGVVVNGTTTSAGQSVNGDTTNMPAGEYFYKITTAASGSKITF